MFRPHSLRSVRASLVVLRATGGAGSPSALNVQSVRPAAPGEVA